MTMLEIEAIEHLDFEPEDECETVFPCGNKAEWLLVHPCCGASDAVCSSCKTGFTLWLNRVDVFGINCTPCGKQGMRAEDFTWRRL